MKCKKIFCMKILLITVFIVAVSVQINKLLKIKEDDIDNDITRAFFPKSPDPKKYFIYYCNGFCGGLGDRQKGIVGAYLLSLFTNRTFGIIHKKPIALSAIFKPNKINWEIPSHRLKGLSFQNHIIRPADKDLIHGFHKLDLTNFYSKDIIYFQSRSDLISELRRHYDTPKLLPILMKLSDREVCLIVLQLLFHLRDDLENYIYRIYKDKIKKRKLVCTHLRMGTNKAIPKDSKPVMPLTETNKIWEFLDQYRNSGKYSIFVATDSDEIKALAIKRFQTQSLVVPGKIIHIDQIKNQTETEGIKKLFLEQILLSRCDILLLTRQSGFSKIAAFIRNTSFGLYCYRHGEVNSCSIDLIDQIYQYVNPRVARLLPNKIYF